MNATPIYRRNRSMGGTSIRRSLGAIAAAIASISISALAEAVVQVGPSAVLAQSTFSYQTYGNGDVVFQLVNTPLPPSECYGFWLRASDPGFKNNFALLLSVIQTQGAVTVVADDSTIWSGSVNKYCLVTGLQL